MNPKSLDSFYPKWKEELETVTPVTESQMYFLTEKSSIKVPSLFEPPFYKNKGNIMLSLNELIRLVGNYIKDLDETNISIYENASGTDILYNNKNEVNGIKVNLPNNESKNIYCKYLILSEGVKGTCTRDIIQKFNLIQNHNYPNYGIGIKEVWNTSGNNKNIGRCIHSFGFPISKHESNAYGGGFVYILKNNIVQIGYVYIIIFLFYILQIVGLDYKNPYINPYNEFQLFKSHPFIRKFIENGERISYGSKIITEGGYYSIPELEFPNGIIIGDSGNLMNSAKIKGVSNAIESGKIGGEYVYNKLLNNNNSKLFREMILNNEIIGKELYESRNVNQAFKYSLNCGIIQNVYILIII